MNKKVSILILIAILMICVVSIAAEKEQKKFELKTLMDKQFFPQIRIPQYHWFNNGKILLLDTRMDKKEQKMELLDPQTGNRSMFLDIQKLLPKSKENPPSDASEQQLWPDAIESNGKALAYIIDDDLYVIDTTNSTLKQLTKTEAVEESVTFSPDGQWLSFIRKNDIYIIAWKTGTEKRLTTGATETLLNGPLSWVYWEEIFDHADIPYSWSLDSKAIAYLQADDSKVPVHEFVHFKPATPEIVQQRYPKAGQTNPQVKLGIVEIDSAKTTWIDCGSYEYLVRFKWLPASKEIAVQTMNRKQSELTLFFADRATGKSHQILHEKDSTWINLNNAPYFLNNNKGFIWLSERDGYQHLYYYNLDGKMIQQLTRGEFMVISYNAALLNKNSGWIYFTSNKDSLKEHHLCRVKLDGTQIEKLSTGNGVHNVDFSPDARYYLDNYSSANILPELSLFKSDGKKIATIAASANSIIASWNLSPLEFKSFKTDDGLELPAIMIKPGNFDPAKKYPAIIYVYGGPGAQQVIDQWTGRHLWHQLLAKEGYFLFVFEVRAGMSKSHKIKSSAYKQAYGMQNVKDIIAGVDWIKQMPYIDQSRIGLWGASGGGCTTLFVMTHSDVFKAGIALAPVSDFYYYDTIYTERYQSTPEDNPQGYKDTSSVLAAKNLKGHLLIIYGTHDDNVHPQNSQAFINELIQNNIQFELMVYPWRKHIFTDIPARIHLYTMMLDFWKRNL